VMELFEKLNQENQATILMVTHDSTVASYCKRVLIIKDGRIYQEIQGGDNRMVFHQKIIDAMNLLGGDERDII
ncbi:MAG: bacitracin ABC transporter ATP-binding protein, partial [Anaerovoracaceae bacterium]